MIIIRQICYKRGIQADNNKLQLFENKMIRTAWDEEKEEWHFSIVDVVAVLTEQKNTTRGKYILGCSEETIKGRESGATAYKL